MQQNSIHNPAQTQNTFPTSGDNFTTVINLDGATDLKGLVEAIDFLDDCAVALTAFQKEKQRTGTP